MMTSVEELAENWPEVNASGGLTKLDSFLQIFCLFQGTCFFLFPNYLQDVGLVTGFLAGCLITVSYLYFSHMYFWSERQLKNFDPTIERVSVYTLVELVFARIGKMPRLGFYLKFYLKYEIILSWCLGMSFSLLFCCQNFRLILHNFGCDIHEKTILLYLILPLALVCFTPNLAAMNKAFYLSSVIVAIISVETFFYMFTDTSSLPKTKLFGSIEGIPSYLNNIVFTINMTPLLFLYRDEMKREKDFTSLFGSLNMAILVTICQCMIYSISCNIRYGDDIRENIIENLPNNLLVNISNMVMTITMILSGSVVFYGIFLSLWEGTLDEMFKNARNVQYYKFATKLIIIAFIIIVTAVTPSLSIFLNFLSCFSQPYDTIILPLALETVIVWRLSESTSKKILVLLKNTILSILAILFAFWSLTDAIVSVFE